MSTELRPVEAVPARSQWPIAVGSAVLAAAVLLAGQRVMGSQAKPAAAPIAAIAPDAAKAPEALPTAPAAAAATPPSAELAKNEVAKTETAQIPLAPIPAAKPAEPIKPAQASNSERRANGLLPRMEVAPAAAVPAPVAVETVSAVPMVPRADLEREVAKLHLAQKEIADLRAQLDGANRELADAKARLAAMPRPAPQPIASDRDQILQTLAPVLKTASTGAP